jgi:hypothetical protein
LINRWLAASSRITSKENKLRNAFVNGSKGRSKGVLMSVSELFIRIKVFVVEVAVLVLFIAFVCKEVMDALDFLLR